MIHNMQKMFLYDIRMTIKLQKEGESETEKIEEEKLGNKRWS